MPLLSLAKTYNIKAIIWLLVLIAIPLVLIILPSDYFDSGETICPSKRFLDLECLGCGLTRGIQHTLHFEFETGWDYNKLSPFILLILIYYWAKLLIKNFRQLKKGNRE